MMAACVTDYKYLSRKLITFKTEFERDTNPGCVTNFPGSKFL